MKEIVEIESNWEITLTPKILESLNMNEGDEVVISRIEEGFIIKKVE